MGGDPSRDAGQHGSAALRSREGQYEQRHDTGQHPGERTRPRSGKGEHSGRQQRHGHIAQEAVRGHRGDIGAEHAPDHHGGHRHGRQHADHRPLRHRPVEGQQQEIDADAGYGLKEQKPAVQHREPHFGGSHAAEGDEQHEEDQNGCDHPPRPGLQRRDRAAQHRPHEHRRRHGHGFHIAVQRFEYVHISKFR